MEMRRRQAMAQANQKQVTGAAPTDAPIAEAAAGEEEKKAE